MNDVPTTTTNTHWAECLRRGEQPSQADLREHLLHVHRHHAGFTESCAKRCRNADGRNSYDLLVDVIDVHRHRTVLDLACGSGALIALCHQRHRSKITLIGVDMSTDELALARQRIPEETLRLHCGMAQDMGFIADASIDVVLCHWALTLMDPIEPVLSEVRRALRPGGIFAAIIDGEMAAAPGYGELNDLIFRWVEREYPGYREIDLGDARVRSAAALTALANRAFQPANVRIEPAVVTLSAAPDVLAREAVGFFYASFVLSPPSHERMLREIEAFFADRGLENHSHFAMPINRLVVGPMPHSEPLGSIN